MSRAARGSDISRRPLVNQMGRGVKKNPSTTMAFMTAADQ